MGNNEDVKLAEGVIILSMTRSRRAIQSIHKGEPLVAVTSPERCIACGKCIEVCPARVRGKLGRARKVQAKIKSCAGCGRCVDVCPNDAIEVIPYSDAIIKLVKYRFNKKLEKLSIDDIKLTSVLDETFREIMG
ncbi:MAG: 4Fe-4S dicluster domain-containing protein [Candidatus Hydrothermarchaeaceae archaeon]